MTVDTTTRTNPEWALDFDEAFTGRHPKPRPFLYIAGQEFPCDAIYLPVTITHGRSSTTVQPEAPTAEFVVKGRVPWTRGDTVEITVAGVRRFTGYIDELETALSAQQYATSVKCVGWLAKAGAVRPSTPPRPQESDVARASHYLEQFKKAFGPWEYRVQGTETVQVIPRDVDGGHTVLDLVHEVCASTGGILWQARDGVLVYGTANHRTGTKARTYIENCDIIDGLAWEKDAGTLVNTAKVKYGTADPRAVYTGIDSASLAADGPKEVSIDSILASEPDALLLSNLILFRRAKPYWSLGPGIAVRTRDMSIEEYMRLLNLEVSDEVEIQVSRDPGDARNLVEWVVEGWVEEWTAEGGELVHNMQIALSDRQRFGLTGIRTVGELAAGFTVATAATMTVRDAMFKEII